MRKNILMGISAVAIMFGAFNAAAQEKPKMDPRNFLPPYEEFLSKQLNLTPEQVTSFKAMRDEDGQKMLPLFDKMEQTRKEMDTIREGNMKKFEETLSPEQKEKFEQFKKEREDERAKMEAKMKEKHEKRMQKMKEKGTNAEMPKHMEVKHRDMKPMAPADAAAPEEKNVPTVPAK